jgi:hypothetical protein
LIEALAPAQAQTQTLPLKTISKSWTIYAILNSPSLILLFCLNLIESSNRVAQNH